jgi:hypothetical protein
LKNDSAWFTTLRVRRQGLGDRPLHRGLVGARLGHHVDEVEQPRLPDHALRGRQRERRQGLPGEVVGGPELGDPGDGERLGGLQAGAQDPHPLADAEPVALCRRGVHHHVVAGSRRIAADEVQAGDLLVGVEADAHGAHVRRDRLAVGRDELRIAVDLSVCPGDAGRALHAREN